MSNLALSQLAREINDGSVLVTAIPGLEPGALLVGGVRLTSLTNVLDLVPEVDGATVRLADAIAFRLGVGRPVDHALDQLLRDKDDNQ